LTARKIREKTKLGKKVTNSDFIGNKEYIEVVQLKNISFPNTEVAKMVMKNK
jgi:hypothetical protein